MTRKGSVEAVAHARLIAILLASCLAFIYVLARPKPAIVLGVLAAFLVWVSAIERHDQAGSSNFAERGSFSSLRNWVDDADHGQQVPLVEHPALNPFGLGELETAFFNLSVSRLYYPCTRALFPEFGEQQVEIGADGTLLSGGASIRASYAVVPTDHGIEGRVVATDRPARLELVQPAGGLLRVASGERARWSCPS
jgi:hypothetical protein